VSAAGAVLLPAAPVPRGPRVLGGGRGGPRRRDHTAGTGGSVRRRSVRRRRASGVRWAVTATVWNSRCRPAGGSAGGTAVRCHVGRRGP